MEDHDKIFEQIKSAVENSEPTNFPAMDKVWNRVEEKLDKKVLKKENKLWKKIAVAATLMLFFTLGYTLLTSDRSIAPSKNDFVTADTLQTTPAIENNNDYVETTTPAQNPEIKKNAQQILDRQINAQSQVVVNNAKLTPENPTLGVAETVAIPNESDKMQPTKSGVLFKNNPPAGHDVQQNPSSVEFMINKQSGETVFHKSDPLMVVDGKALTKKEFGKGKALSDISPEEAEEIVILNEPLYIINGIKYSEKDLFGPIPTSPYAPLNEQEIENITVLQGDEAAAYGKEGKKGVVIITTKSGKPKAKKAK